VALVALFLPGLRLLAAGTGTAPVLVQLAGWRLPVMRRPRRHTGVRRGARGRSSRTAIVQRRSAGLGPAQRALFPADPVPGGALRFRRGHAVAEASRGRPEGHPAW